MGFFNYGQDRNQQQNSRGGEPGRPIYMQNSQQDRIKNGWAFEREIPKGNAVQPYHPDDPMKRRVFRRYGMGPFNLFQFDFADGEFHRVLSRGLLTGHEPLLDMRSRRERVAAQLQGRTNRRKSQAQTLGQAFMLTPQLLIAVAVWALVWERGSHDPATYTKYLYAAGKFLGQYLAADRLHHYYNLLTGGEVSSLAVNWFIFAAIVVFGAGIIRIAAIAVWNLLAPLVLPIKLLLPEIVYQLGFQWSFIDGAKVFDAPASENIPAAKQPQFSTPMDTGEIFAQKGPAGAWNWRDWLHGTSKTAENDSPI